MNAVRQTHLNQPVARNNEIATKKMSDTTPGEEYTKWSTESVVPSNHFVYIRWQAPIFEK